MLNVITSWRRPAPYPDRSFEPNIELFPSGSTNGQLSGMKTVEIRQQCCYGRRIVWPDYCSVQAVGAVAVMMALCYIDQSWLIPRVLLR
jgi:hypothetical protein